MEALSRGLTQKMLHGLPMAELNTGDANARERAHNADPALLSA